MAVKIRLSRRGKKKFPSYRIVVIDSRHSREGKFIENIGFYNPCKDPFEFKINEEAAKKWLKNGAIPSPTVKNLLKRIKII